MGLVKTRRLAAMRKQTAYAKASTFAKATVDKTVVRQRAILLRHPPALKLRQTRGCGGVKSGLTPPMKRFVARVYSGACCKDAELGR